MCVQKHLCGHNKLNCTGVYNTQKKHVHAHTQHTNTRTHTHIQTNTQTITHARAYLEDETAQQLHRAQPDAVVVAVQPLLQGRQQQLCACFGESHHDGHACTHRHVADRADLVTQASQDVRQDLCGGGGECWCAGIWKR